MRALYLKEEIMKFEIIEIESEKKGPIVGGELPRNDNTDVVVKLENGKQYWATFFTYDNIEFLTKKNREHGENLSGKYFWSRNMILIEEINRDLIENVIKEMLAALCFDSAFEEITG